MFSGIVEQVGKIISFENNILLIEEPNLSKELNISESIAINGICLTVINKHNNSFSVEVTPETIKRTNLKDLNLNSIDFNKCLNNEKISDKILVERIEAQKKYSISSTPTIIINEKKLDNADLESIKNKIEELI